MKKIQFNDKKNIISENSRKYREKAGMRQSRLAAFCEVLNVGPRDMLSGFYENS